MDSLFTIAFGLTIRAVVSFASYHSVKTAGTLIGLWEGIVLVHFLSKNPRSTDPYVGFAVRMFVDYLWTESLFRFLLVLVWTGLG
ncbi:hypothetical protein K435DRAFT_619651, partial [Dendrothele bispora CBS 962.96]